MDRESVRTRPLTDCPEAILRLAQEIDRALGTALAKEPPPACLETDGDPDDCHPGGPTN